MRVACRVDCCHSEFVLRCLFELFVVVLCVILFSVLFDVLVYVVCCSVCMV